MSSGSAELIPDLYEGCPFASRSVVPLLVTVQAAVQT